MKFTQAGECLVGDFAVYRLSEMLDQFKAQYHAEEFPI